MGVMKNLNSMNWLMKLGALSLISCTAQSTVAGAPAFPNAQGWGKDATGGRRANTKILFVTSLEDSGPGTLREALMQSGPRIILFKTGGIIDLKSSISFRDGDVTIAGQTAPGDGIILRNYPIRIGASNVIMRGIRIRNGDGPGPTGDLRDSIQVGRVAKLSEEKIHDIIIDHCSFGWSMDETVEFWYGSRNVTLSHNIFSEALWKSQHPYTVKGSPYGGHPGHGYAMLFGNGACEKISLYQNLFAHNERRNPWVKDNARVEIINNVIYNWGTEATGLWNTAPDAPSAFANIIGNYYKAGANTERGNSGINLFRVAAPGSKFYLRGNIGPGRLNNVGEEWDAAQVGKDVDLTKYRAAAPIADLESGIKALPAEAAFEQVLHSVGAVPRDGADKRAVETTRTGTGHKIDKLAEVGGYPAYAAGQYPSDADEDGIPDTWEMAHGLNPKDKMDATKTSDSGYLNIENYINSLFPSLPTNPVATAQ
jgi:hypothetical protein